MPSATAPHALHGDVTVESTRLHVKGGSMTATLKKSLRGALEASGDTALGARLDFDDEHSLVLLVLLVPAGAEQPGRIRATRLSGTRFVVDLVDGEPEAPDDVTAAFLMLTARQLREGQRSLVDADAGRARLAALLGEPPAVGTVHGV